MEDISLAAFSVPALLIIGTDRPQIRLNTAAAGTFGIDGTSPAVSGGTVSADELPAATREAITPILEHIDGDLSASERHAACRAPDGNSYDVRLYRVDEPGQPAVLALCSPGAESGPQRALIHDLRNHLNAISINGDVSSVLLDAGTDGHEAKIRAALGRITQNARQAAGKLEDLGGVPRNDTNGE